MPETASATAEFPAAEPAWLDAGDVPLPLLLFSDAIAWPTDNATGGESAPTLPNGVATWMLPPVARAASPLLSIAAASEPAPETETVPMGVSTDCDLAIESDSDWAFLALGLVIAAPAPELADEVVLPLPFPEPAPATETAEDVPELLQPAELSELCAEPGCAEDEDD